MPRPAGSSSDRSRETARGRRGSGKVELSLLSTPSAMGGHIADYRAATPGMDGPVVTSPQLGVVGDRLIGRGILGRQDTVAKPHRLKGGEGDASASQRGRGPRPVAGNFRIAYPVAGSGARPWMLIASKSAPSQQACTPRRRPSVLRAQWRIRSQPARFSRGTS